MLSDKKSNSGRSLLADGFKKDTQIVIRVRAGTKEAWRNAAEAERIYLQNWIENACAAALKRSERKFATAGELNDHVQ